MTEPNRAPNLVWLLRRDQFAPFVYTTAGEKVVIDCGNGEAVEIDRRDARLLAKRINQCLTETAKR